MIGLGAGKRRRAAIVGIGLVGCAGLVAVVVAWLSGSPPSLGPLPGPNGYDDLVAAGRLIKKELADPNQANDDALREHLAAHSAALERGRVGLGRKARVPVTYSTQFIPTHLPDVQALRALARLLDSEGRLAEREGRTAEALRADLDLLRLGRAAARGGVFLDALVGVAIERTGLDGLWRIADRLDAAQLRAAVAALGAADRDEEPLSGFSARERGLARVTGGITLSLARQVHPTMQKMEQQAIDSTDRAIRRGQARRRLTRADFARRLYVRERGVEPSRLEDLVPDHLDAVPIDPYGTGPVRYRPGDPLARLYSVGPDGRDDGGKPAVLLKDPSAPGDLVLGSPRW